MFQRFLNSATKSTKSTVSEYELILSSLEYKITTLESKLVKDSTRHSAVHQLLWKWSLWISVIFAISCYFAIEYYYIYIPLAFILIFIIYYALTKLLNLYFGILKKQSTNALEKYNSKYQSSIQDLKNATAYNTTKDLLMRFDTPRSKLNTNNSTANVNANSTINNTNNNTREDATNRPKPKIPIQPHPQLQPQIPVPAPGLPNYPIPNTPQNIPPKLPQSEAPKLIPAQTPIQNIQSQVTPSNSPSKTWIEKILDGLVGDIGGPQSKYALVCQKCFTHNGLVPPELYATTSFKCMKCQFLNPSKFTYHDSVVNSELTRDKSSITKKLEQAKQDISDTIEVADLKQNLGLETKEINILDKETLKFDNLESDYSESSPTPQSKSRKSGMKKRNLKR